MMHSLFFYLLGTLLEHCGGHSFDYNVAQYCRDNANKPVSWWYIYKPPADVIPPFDGLNFSYITPDTGGRWIPSPVDITDDNMLHKTLMPAFKRNGANRAVVMFESRRDQLRRTAARGLVSADRAGGYLLSHTVPGFPEKYNLRSLFPPEELKYGHLLSCVSLDIDALNEVAMAIREMAPHIRFVNVPVTLSDLLPEWNFVSIPFLNHIREPSIYYLSKGNESGLISSTDAVAMLVARSPGVKSCIYTAFAEKQQIMLNVYGQSKRKFLSTVCSEDFGVRNIEFLCLKYKGPDTDFVYYVTNSNDHSRFAVSTAAHWQQLGSGPRQFWVCTGLLDKEAAALGAAGWLLCLQHYELWVAFDNLKVAEPSCD